MLAGGPQNFNQDRPPPRIRASPVPGFSGKRRPLLSRWLTSGRISVLLRPVNPNTQLLLITVTAVAVLIALIAKLRFHAFIALLLAAFGMGLASGMEPLKVASSFKDGVGASLGGIAGVLGLGTMLGGLLAASGGAEVLARWLVQLLGPKRVHICLMLVATAVGMTTWFAVGLVMLVPILISLAKETGQPFLKLAIPMLAVLSIMHGVMPPHPGPLVAIDALHANLGRVIMWGFVAAIPVAAISGPLFARWAVKNVAATTPEPPPLDPELANRPRPTLGRTIATLACPILLILSQTITEMTLPKGDPFRSFTDIIGEPSIALCISVLFATWALGFTRGTALKIAEKSLGAIGMTLLLVGGGGGFNRVLKDSGATKALGEMAQAAHLGPMLFGWLCAALIRIATGSATVAITGASGMVAGMLAANPDLHPNKELLVVGIGCGSMILSHLNDSGFWVVKETLGLTVAQTLRTWTVTETLIGITGLAVASLLSLWF